MSDMRLRPCEGSLIYKCNFENTTVGKLHEPLTTGELYEPTKQDIQEIIEYCDDTEYEIIDVEKFERDVDRFIYGKYEWLDK